MDHGGRGENGTDNWHGFEEAEDCHEELSEEQKESVHLQDKTDCCEEGPPNHDQEEAAEEHNTAVDFARSAEEHGSLFDANERHDSHYEGQLHKNMN